CVADTVTLRVTSAWEDGAAGRFPARRKAWLGKAAPGRGSEQRTDHAQVPFLTPRLQCRPCGYRSDRKYWMTAWGKGIGVIRYRFISFLIIPDSSGYIFIAKTR